MNNNNNNNNHHHIDEIEKYMHLHKKIYAQKGLLPEETYEQYMDFLARKTDKILKSIN